MYRRYLDERAHRGHEWNSAAVDSESLLRLTAGELADLKQELLDVLRKYDDQGRAREAAGETEGREHIALHMYGFPFRVPRLRGPLPLTAALMARPPTPPPTATTTCCAGSPPTPPR